MYFVGVDPGASGAIAVLAELGPKTIRLSETPRDVFRFLCSFTEDFMADTFGVIEQVNAMPKQGVASSFKFGVSYGMLQGFLTAAEVPFERVTPAKWQAEMKCRTKGDKNVTKRLAQEMFPSVKITHHEADAILLAVYASRLYQSRLVKEA